MFRKILFPSPPPILFFPFKFSPFPKHRTLLSLSPNIIPHAPLRFFCLTSPMSTDSRPRTVSIPAADVADRSDLIRALETSLGSHFSSDPIAPTPSPLIVVISGPSGVGKDAVINRLTELRRNLHFVVTCTSRAKRPGETEGKDYYFVTKEQFLRMVEQDELLEHALVYGEYKGIPKQQVRDLMGKGYDVVLRVDIQGAETLRRVLGQKAVFVFLTAESEAKMVERLVDRRTERKEELLVRIATAREEVKRVSSFDYVVVNKEGELEKAVQTVEAIIDAEKAKVRQRNAVL
ncbi:hypothetical protein SO802_027453 [Lithocarpus litseifolius]|uniref:guanylate kinase n=1 Tax=Lithocarpus litseifolius TaxID=425828 RepID=A0AAW2C3F2_9ROSI